MERIILIETSTALCSVALAENGVIVDYRESSAPKAHASLTAVFIQEMLAERGLSVNDCDAVCVSMGPGSYTGLRVGVSTAKGLCFGAKIPLIAVGTLDTLVAQAGRRLAPPVQNADKEGTSVMSSEVGTSADYKYIVPMIDARRMEVYTAVFKKNDLGNTDHIIPSETGNRDREVSHFGQITETAPMIIDENSLADILADGPVLFIGDGAGKCADVIKHPNAHFRQCHPKASSMLSPALTEFRSGNFRDVAYFEPFYLKEFVATVSKKKLF